MEGGPRDFTTTWSSSKSLHLHTQEPLRRAALNRLFAAVYTLALLLLLYHHTLTLVTSTTISSFLISLSFTISDLILALQWSTTQSYRMYPIRRKEFPEKLEQLLDDDHTLYDDLPRVDVLIFTADPFKEPPMSVVNTALSVMGYDYPAEKLSVFVSDDGGSQLTLFAFMEASKFAAHWLPFCKEKKVVERNPEEYFASNHSWDDETKKIKVENAVERGKVDEESITGERERQAFSKWTKGCTRHDHPSIIQVLLQSSEDRDIAGNLMPSLVYVSREKSPTSPHNFKAGALNALIRVSASMSNAPIILSLDCDTYSNDPKTVLRVLCYLVGPEARPNLGFIQFPQRFRGINKSDIYGSEYRYLFRVNIQGFDGLYGANLLGTGCFYLRKVFFGTPSALELPQDPRLAPNHLVDNPISSPQVLELAHHVSGCNYEKETTWGSKMGFRYGSLVEDYYTSLRLHCEGWQSIFSNPERPAFLGDSPSCLIDALNQNKRWCIGLQEVFYSKYSPITFGTRSMGLLMGLAYSNLTFWPTWSFPIATYGFLPQLALLNGVTIFPKVSETWFLLYTFLVLGAYGQDILDFVLEGGTIRKWWSDQRMWMIRGLSSYLFAILEYFPKYIGISTHGFNVTSKVLDTDLSKRYEQGIFEFGVASPMFVPPIMAALLNLVSSLVGIVQVIRGSELDGLFMQIFLASFVMVVSLPIYEAMFLRKDRGRIPTKTTILSVVLTLASYQVGSFLLF
ncbi:hypothetical protein UlMin_002596 [Ulmus minor]